MTPIPPLHAVWHRNTASGVWACHTTTAMFSTLIHLLLLYLISTVFAKPSRVVDDQTLQSDLRDLHLPSLPSSMPSSSNATLSSLNATVSNSLSIECNGKEYGFNPDVADCTAALRRQLVGSDQVRFGQRGSISSEKFLPLPYRLMGGMWLAPSTAIFDLCDHA